VVSEFAHVLVTLAAQAPEPASGDGSALMPLLTIALPMFAVIYFMLIRPQSKQQREHDAFLSTLQKGMEVATYGGMLGKVHAVSDTAVTLEVAKDVRIQVLKSYVYRPPAAPSSKDAEKAAPADGKTAEAKK
jgi:preprotein translocase subunit YajC